MYMEIFSFVRKRVLLSIYSADFCIFKFLKNCAIINLIDISLYN